MALADDYKEKAKRRYEFTTERGRCTPSGTNANGYETKKALAKGHHLLGHLPLSKGLQGPSVLRIVALKSSQKWRDGVQSLPIMDEVELLRRSVLRPGVQRPA